MLEKVSQDSQRRNVTSPSQCLSMGTEIRPSGQSGQHSSEAVEHCLCSGTAPCMPASAPWCPTLYRYTLSKGQRCSLTFSRKNVGTRGCAPARDGVCSTTWCPLFPEIRHKPIPACMGTVCKVPKGYSSCSLMHCILGPLKH